MWSSRVIQNPSFQDFRKKESPGMGAPERLVLPCFHVVSQRCMLGAVDIKWLSAQPL